MPYNTTYCKSRSDIYRAKLTMGRPKGSKNLAAKAPKPKEQVRLTETVKKTIIELFEEGATKQQVLEVTGTSQNSLDRWLRENEALRLQYSKSLWRKNRKVENALQKSALGYKEVIRSETVHEDGSVTTKEQEVFQPPNATAGIFLLKAREKWSDRHDELAQQGQVTIVFNTPRPEHIIYESEAEKEENDERGD